MKELIDLIKPTILVQLRSSSPHFRHTMPEINPIWSLNAPVSNIYRQTNQISLKNSYNNYNYHLLLTPVRQHSHGKANLTRQACLWAYFAQIEVKNTIIKPIIDYINHVETFNFDKIGIGLLHREVEPKYFLEVLNGSIIALCRVKQDMVIKMIVLFFSLNKFIWFNVKKRRMNRSNLLDHQQSKGNDETTAGVMKIILI